MSHARSVPYIAPLPPDLCLTPVSRRPTRLADATVKALLNHPLPTASGGIAASTDTFSAGSASVVVVTYNNLPFTRACLESLLTSTEPGSYEIVVVDNASTDGTDAYLRALAKSFPFVRPVFNSTNRGFAPACNQGLALARGDVLVLLNNDVVVSRGWLTRLTRHLANPEIGLVGPVTNRIGNEAQIRVEYDTYGQFVRFAQDRAEMFEGEAFDIPVLTMFCLAMQRDAFQHLGPLDEQFEVGMLEDDDYSARARAAGYRIVCADDVFVHHFGETSFGKLVPTGEHARVLAANRERFEKKWGIPWQPYKRRYDVEYDSLIGRIRAVVADVVPPDATVLVVSRGDDEFLDLAGPRAWHFPRSEDGRYAGYYPADSEQAVKELEVARSMGGNFLLFPATAFWWLEHYAGLRQHLERHYAVLVMQREVCAIFALQEAFAAA